MATTYLSAAALADKIGTDARTIRKFLRADRAAQAEVKGDAAPTAPGKGSQWAIEAREVRALTARFNKWTKAQEEARASKAADKAAREAAKGEEVDTDEAPSAEALEMLEEAGFTIVAEDDEVDA